MHNSFFHIHVNVRSIRATVCMRIFVCHEHHHYDLVFSTATATTTTLVIITRMRWLTGFVSLHSTTNRQRLLCVHTVLLSIRLHTNRAKRVWISNIFSWERKLGIHSFLSENNISISFFSIWRIYMDLTRDHFHNEIEVRRSEKGNIIFMSVFNISDTKRGGNCQNNRTRKHSKMR